MFTLGEIREIMRAQSPAYKFGVVKAYLTANQSEGSRFCQELIDIALRELSSGQKLNEPALDPRTFLYFSSLS